MSLLGIGSIIEGVGKISDNLVTTDEERLQLALKGQELEGRLLEGQMEINKQEAQNPNLFVAGWRPFIGWVGGIALAYQFLLYPVLLWFWATFQATGVIPCHFASAPLVEITQAAAEVANSQATVGGRAAEELAKALVPVTEQLSECTVKPPAPLSGELLFAIVTSMLGIGGLRSFDKLKKTDTRTIGNKSTVATAADSRSQGPQRGGR
ncbi:3TM-type holin [Oceanobacter kriegii]|uniref:3TM-type holin n=1 Tax=Oceanobacter kriegii TaxID=64972 RepID=UPI000426C129|nr:3TM-type holin [Oceanobacter kriegii]